jgi:hypothetical protein
MELTGKEPPKDVLESLNFESIEAMRIQLSNWGLPGWLMSWATTGEQNDRRRKAKEGGGNKVELPPAVAAHRLFEAAIERLQKATRQLPLRKDHRQDGRIVSERSVPFLEDLWQSAGYNYLIAPPDAEPNEHGWVRYTGAEAHRLEPAGARRYPDEQLAALIGAALLSGESADELLDTLRPGADDKVRKKAHRLLEGKDGLKPRARQIASLMRGGTSGQGQRHEESVSPEEHAAAWFIAEQRYYGVPDSEILERLRSKPTLLRETKKHRRVTLDDVKRLGSLRLQGFPD